MFVIAIDFGTFQSEAAYLDITGKPVIISNHRGDDATPTVVYYQKNGSHLIGRDALEQGYLDPAHCVRNFKLKLGTTENLLPGPEVMTATDAAAIVIGQLKADAEKALNVKLTQVIATAPANFRDDAKQALIEAYKRHGLEVIKLVPEPTAAGIAYGQDKVSQSNFLVFDFGGGTFDISVMKKLGDTITILATEGVPHLGGKDINACIEKYMLDKIASQTGACPDPAKDNLLFYDLAERSELAKISLSNPSRKEVPITVSYKGQQFVEKMTQNWFRKAIDPLIDQAIVAMDAAVKAAGLTYPEINSLIMVGGTSRIGYIQDRVAQHTGLYPKTDIDPLKAIVYGAAIAGIAELAQQGKTVSINGQVIPAPDLVIQDVTAHDIGCSVVDNSGQQRKVIHNVMLPKNTPIPCSHSSSFYLEFDDQTEVQLEILQGKARADRNDCLIIGQAVLSNLSLENKRTDRILVHYQIDGNGMVTATVTDKISGQSKTVSVDYRHGVQQSAKSQVA